MLICNKYLFWVFFLLTIITYSVLGKNINISGFLTPDMAPDSLAILPPPPAEESIAFLNDKALYDKGKIYKDLPRIETAKHDADYKNFADSFSLAFGHTISAKETPMLYQLLEKLRLDSHDYAVRSAKENYHRIRPFVFFHTQSCTPEYDSKMKNTGSYPSGHASFGWAVALVLAEINAVRQKEILQKGYEYGQNRVVCGAHWQSDVDAGRLMGAAIVAALHANKEFKWDLNKAKREFVLRKIKLHQDISYKEE